jgi:hypothetical protein
VKADFSASTARRLSVGLVGCALIATAALVSAPAQATPRSATSTASASTGTACITPTSRPTKGRRAPDTDRVSRRVAAQVASELRATARSSAMRTTFADLSSRATAARGVVVPVYIHLIKGRHKGEHRIGKHAARRMFRTLKAGYEGGQDQAMAPTGVRFKLRRITVSRNDAWFHARPYSRADRQMKNRLHRGTARMLNIYVNRPRLSGFLGFSTFPWQRAWRRNLDGVTVSDVSLPGGRMVGYNLGDTVIHETGHWLGLLHTFEGGCGDGDDVADTPAEAGPSYRCVEGSNTCPIDPLTGAVVDDGLLDPIHNFMDYSYDACMYQFTPGQSARMMAAFMRFRYRH